MIERLASSPLLFFCPSFLSNFKSLASFPFFFSRYTTIMQFHHKQTWSVAAFRVSNPSRLYFLSLRSSRPLYYFLLLSSPSLLLSPFETGDSYANPSSFNAPIGRKLLTSSRVCLYVPSFDLFHPSSPPFRLPSLDFNCSYL